MKFFVSAGEVSGDFHAATVVAELRARFPSSEVFGVAGSQMIREGCQPLHPLRDLNVMGVGDVLRALGRIRRVERSLLAWCDVERPAVVILVDFSSFHMRLGAKIRAMGIPVIHFIAPKLWAWGAWRVKKLKRSQDRLAAILPFEPAWFAEHGIEANYVGNPSAVSCSGGWSSSDLKKRLKIDDNRFLLTLLPGSRPQEIKAHVGLLAEVLRSARLQYPDIAVVVPLAPGVNEAWLAPLWRQGAMPLARDQEGYALRADAAVAVSGTATLELALWNVPTVLVYRGSPLMMFLIKRLVKVKCAGLANIILGDQAVMPEFLQQEATSKRVIGALLPLLVPASEEVATQRQAFARLRQQLGVQKPAEGVVDMVDELLFS